MLGQPISMLIPEVIGFELTGAMMEGTTGTDLVLKVVEMLREKGVSANSSNSTAKGWTVCRWPTVPPSPTWPRIRRDLWLLPDRQRNPALPAHTGRDEDRIALVEAYAKENGFWRGDDYAPSTQTRCTSTWAQSFLPSPARSARRTMWH